MASSKRLVRRSAEVVFDVGYFSILSRAVCGDDLQHQVTHVSRQGLLAGLNSHLGEAARRHNRGALIGTKALVQMPQAPFHALRSSGTNLVPQSDTVSWSARES